MLPPQRGCIAAKSLKKKEGIGRGGRRGVRVWGCAASSRLTPLGIWPQAELNVDVASADFTECMIVSCLGSSIASKTTLALCCVLLLKVAN